MPYGQEGEICLTGPSMMLGYIGHEEENAQTLQKHPDALKMQRVKAFVVLRDGFTADEAVRESLIAHCKAHIAKYALPSEIEFRESLPTTLVGKVAYTVLEKEEAEKRA